jgi:hypothetical protein
MRATLFAIAVTYYCCVFVSAAVDVIDLEYPEFCLVTTLALFAAVGSQDFMLESLMSLARFVDTGLASFVARRQYIVAASTAFASCFALFSKLSDALQKTFVALFATRNPLHWRALAAICT